MKGLAVVLLLSLAGCAGGGPGGPPGEQASCERQSDDDPVVKDLLMRSLGNSYALGSKQEAIRVAKQDATVRCLQNRGVLRPGGVERQKPLG